MNPGFQPTAFLTAAWLVLAGSVTAAELEMSAVFGDNMVIQRDMPIHVWGWTEPNGEVAVRIDDGEPVSVKAGGDGRFDAELPAMPHDDAVPHTLMVTAGDATKTLDGVLIGEVFLCSGQSNMSWAVQNSYDADLESLTANYPNIRIISVPNRAAQSPQRTFDGAWEEVTPESVKDFSAVGYFFGRQIHQTLGVPVGLIDNAWGGSAAEAWVPRETLQSEPMYDNLIAQWDTKVAKDDYEDRLTAYREKMRAIRQSGSEETPPSRPRNELMGNSRIGNLYYGCLTPIIGYPIRATIWYQGESNAGEATQYQDLFPRLIRKWREDWDQDFSFYWVQLADFMKESSVSQKSNWAALREAQTMTTALPKTGQAVIIDLGEAKDIHPRDKLNVAKRLARLSLANDFGYDIVHRSPVFRSARVESSAEGPVVMVDFDHVGGGLNTFDVHEVRGFTVSGEDGKFVEATGRVVDEDTVAVSGEGVQRPVEIRYGWANNPVVNLESREGLPATPFRVRLD